MNEELKFTPGPWRWELNMKSKQVQLSGGNPKYDLTVMDFARWGMGGAAPRFREDVDRMNIMHRCEKWAIPQSGREHHARWFQILDHPDSLLIQAAPDLFHALWFEKQAKERANNHANECSYAGCDFKGCPHAEIWSDLEKAEEMKSSALAKALGKEGA